MMCYFICGMACERAFGSDDLVDKFLCWMFPCLFETGTISPNIEYPRESIMWSWIWGLSCWLFSAIGIFHCLLSCPKQKTYSIYTSSCVGLDFPIWDIATYPRWKHEKWNYKVHGKPFPGAYLLLHPLGRELIRTLFTVHAKMNIYIYRYIYITESHWRRWWASALARTHPNHPLNELALCYSTLRSSYNCGWVSEREKEITPAYSWKLHLICVSSGLADFCLEHAILRFELRPKQHLLEHMTLCLIPLVHAARRRV